MSTISYAIQGKRNGEWVTLFAPITTSNEAVLRVRELAKANPACRYRVRWQSAGEPIVEQWSQPRNEYGGAQ